MKTKPGAIMIGGVLIGKPLASTAYVVNLQQAGSNVPQVWLI